MVGLLIIERDGERSDLSLDFKSVELDCYSHCPRQKERNTKRNKERKKERKECTQVENSLWRHAIPFTPLSLSSRTSCVILEPKSGLVMTRYRSTEMAVSRYSEVKPRKNTTKPDSMTKTEMAVRRR